MISNILFHHPFTIFRQLIYCKAYLINLDNWLPYSVDDFESCNTRNDWKAQKKRKKKQIPFSHVCFKCRKIQNNKFESIVLQCSKERQVKRRTCVVRLFVKQKTKRRKKTNVEGKNLLLKTEHHVVVLCRPSAVGLPIPNIGHKLISIQRGGGKEKIYWTINFDATCSVSSNFLPPRCFRLFAE